jgi:hypothetical protein
MEKNDYQVPDLASILRTLAALTPQQSTPQLQHYATPPTDIHQANPNQLRSQQATSTSEKPKLIDPATIMEWSSALRCVMKTVAANDTILAEIRRVRTTKPTPNLLVSKLISQSY